jgi:hypothetical protein
MPFPILSKLALFSAVAVPTLTLSLAAYLIEHPLPSSKTRTILSRPTLSSSCTSSSSLRLVNPRNHKAWADSYSIRLSSRDVGEADDEEILAKFVKGYFGGWIFAPENTLLSLLHAFDSQLFPVGFSSKCFSVKYIKHLGAPNTGYRYQD